MQCPVDGETLMMSDRNGVEIDYCPKCRGVWLDRGELDKIIDRAGISPASGGVTPPAPQPVQHPEPRRQRREGDDDDYGHPRGKRRDSFLSDIFDF